jgi:chemotaxis protein CheC
MRELTDLEIDALKEMTSIGTAHAATALSELLNKEVNVIVPQLKILEVAKIPGALGGGEQAIVGLYFKISGHISGSILLFLDEPAAKELINIMLTSVETENIPGNEALRKSAIMELGNILSNSYLNALAEFIDITILLSVPHFAVDTLGSVMDFLLIEMVKAADCGLLMQTVIKVQGSQVTANFLLFPDSASFDTILDRIGLK